MNNNIRISEVSAFLNVIINNLNHILNNLINLNLLFDINIADVLLQGFDYYHYEINSKMKY